MFIFVVSSTGLVELNYSNYKIIGFNGRVDFSKLRAMTSKGRKGGGKTLKCLALRDQ